MAFNLTPSTQGAFTTSRQVPVAFSDVTALRSHFGSALQNVPGFLGAYVAQGPAGKQLFIDTRAIKPTQGTVTALWKAAFGAVPQGYQPQLFVDPTPKVAYLVVIAIIAILIGLLVPAVWTVSTPGPTAPSTLTVSMDSVLSAVRWH